ncbi:cytochrome P450 [Sanghuangporus baumii]|uniref:Cytochrome P450 n=1 Tax=Sanghuangporus baumii TaxID=108892 RepID=A0A9Q5N7G2_SANBA|nr:cytochrome P450 [Sanghuangporus baumii]
MGDMVFGGGFDLMKNESGGGIRKVVEDNMKMVGILEHTSWITDQLRKEVESEFPPSKVIRLMPSKSPACLTWMLLLMRELHIQPPLPTSLQRCPLEGSGGKWVAGRFIPESTAVYIPAYVLYRDPRYFSPSPDSFIPERRLDNEAKDQEYSMNALAYIPFSFGPANCAGKNLALLETRMVIAMIVQRFDMGFAAGHDPRQWEEELKDYFVIKVGELPVILRTRL